MTIWHWLGGGGGVAALVALAFRTAIVEWVKDLPMFKPKKDHGDQPPSRTEFEHRMQGFHDALMAHTAQARVDNRELKAELKADLHDLKVEVKEVGRDLFQKLDAFKDLFLMVKGNK
jgi:hypothetical protein